MVVSVVVVDGGMDGGGGKEPLSFVDGAKSSVGVCRCLTSRLVYIAKRCGDIDYLFVLYTKAIVVQWLIVWLL